MKRISFRIITALAVGCLLIPTTFGQSIYRGSYTKGDVNRIIARVETHSNAFQRDISRMLDRGDFEDSRREERLNEQVMQMARAIENLRGEFDRVDTWRDARYNVQEVLNQADDVSRMMIRNNFPWQIRAEWAGLRRDLNMLASAYDLPRLRA